MNKTVTVRISGKQGPETNAPSVGDLLDQMRDYFDLLGIIEETLAEDGESAIVWRIVDAVRVNPFTFTIQAFARQYAVNIDSRADQVVDKAVSGLRLLEKTAERPPCFTEQALVKAERIFERVTNGLDQTEILTEGESPVVLTPDIARGAARNVRLVRTPSTRPYKEFGSLEGYFQSVGSDGRGGGKPVLYIRSRITGDEIKCFVSDQAEREVSHAEVGDVWRGRRMSVSGTIHYRCPGRVSHVDAVTIRFLRSRSDLPDFEDIIDPDFTGGLRSEDYLERLRDGELS